MKHSRWMWVVLLAAAVVPAVGSAQGDRPAGPRSAVGLFGFSARGGVDFEGSGQAVVSVGVDAGHLFTDRLRLRPSGELGFLSGDNTYLASFEVLYRFTSDRDVAVPYVGGGLGVWGREACDTDDRCPGLWVQAVLGFELRVRDGLAWMVEYHPVDAFRRHRVLIGLTTRRAP